MNIRYDDSIHISKYFDETQMDFAGNDYRAINMESTFHGGAQGREDFHLNELRNFISRDDVGICRGTYVLACS